MFGVWRGSVAERGAGVREVAAVPGAEEVVVGEVVVEEVVAVAEPGWEEAVSAPCCGATVSAPNTSSCEMYVC